VTSSPKLGPWNLPNDGEGDALVSAHLGQLEQTVRSLYHPDTMALPSGIYTIENVKYRNWAMLLNANEGKVVAGSSASTNVGERVSLSKI
jgi:hypothetical protein